MKHNLKFLYRKKSIHNIDENGENKLQRVLTIFDLTALGVGTTLGSGIYVLAGSVIKNVAGPSIVLSFLIAAIVSIIAALCYSELGARVPKTGSAYAYTYVCVGEFMAFIIGWNLLLEYAIGSASVARAFSNYLDSLINNSMQNFFREYMPIDVPDLSKYPDFFCFGFAILITAIVSVGVKESAFMNKMFTLVNLSVILFVVVFGAIHADIHNWEIKIDELPTNWSMNSTNFTAPCNSTATCGTGGFFPFGFKGTLEGTAKCFIAFIGFDSISTTGGEVMNPQKAIPLSIISSLLICCVVYCGVSMVLGLMIPYYLIDQNAPMPDAFRYVHWDWARYLVAIGALVSLATCLLSAMFALSRVLYAIAEDGLVFRFLARVNKRFQTPFIATWCCGLLAATMAMIFELQELVNMTSIGTLLAYSLVAISVLILRYHPVRLEIQQQKDIFDEVDAEIVHMEKTLIKEENCKDEFLKSLFAPSPRYPTERISKLVYICTAIIVCLLFSISLMIVNFGEKLIQTDNFEFYAFVILCFASIVLITVVYRQPQNRQAKTFQTPFVPIFPFISVFVNFYLIMVLPVATWIRFAVWMVIGLVIYFAYGIRHSSENDSYKMKQVN